MSVELKAGYWRSKDGESYELFCERDGLWFGRIVGREVAVMRDMDDARRAGWTYLGPTLPPDPGEGWRLLRKLPEPEPVEKGDEYLDGKWRTVIRAWDDTWSDRTQVAERWYRRRETPEPPQPPGEFDVGEGYRRLEVGETRLRTDEYLPNSGDGSDREWVSCNSLECGWLAEPVKSWMVPHRRRIEPQPVCPWCVKPVPQPDEYVACPHCNRSFSFKKPAVPGIDPPFEGEVRWFACEDNGQPMLRAFRGNWYVQRQFHDGEWRDVGVQQ